MDILLKPIVTEKMSTKGETLNQFGFIVNKHANKLEIKAAVEKIYNVKVIKVNTQQYVGKIKSRNTERGIAIGRTNRNKRAFVILKEGDKIDFYASI